MVDDDRRSHRSVRTPRQIEHASQRRPVESPGGRQGLDSRSARNGSAGPTGYFRCDHSQPRHRAHCGSDRIFRFGVAVVERTRMNCPCGARQAIVLRLSAARQHNGPDDRRVASSLRNYFNSPRPPALPKIHATFPPLRSRSCITVIFPAVRIRSAWPW